MAPRYLHLLPAQEAITALTGEQVQLLVDQMRQPTTVDVALVRQNARAVVAAHEGEIEVESSPGLTCFRVSLPLS